MNWDDLRIAAAVHKCGSYAGASAQLGIDETTVGRRLSRLQRDLGFTLFEAVDGQRRPTAACQDLLTHVERISRHVFQIEDIGSVQQGPTGRYRIAATDSMAVEILAPKTAAFLADHSGLTLHFLVSTESVNFSRWEADIAIRFHKPDRGDFIISKLADIGFLLFEPKDAPAAAQPLVCAYPEDLDKTPESEFLSELGLKPSARCLSKNLLVVQSLLRTGRCSGILPDYMCRPLRGDPRFTTTRLKRTREVWLLLQNHLKQDPGARSVVDWIRACFAKRGE